MNSENTRKYKIYIAILMAAVMILQPGLVFAKSVSEGITKDPTALEEFSDSKFQLPEIEKLKAVEKGELLGFTSKDKTSSIETGEKIETRIYIDSEEIHIRRLILQKNTVPNLEQAAVNGLELKETPNEFSDLEDFIEYELNYKAAKKNTVYPLELETKDTSEGIVALLLAEDKESQAIITSVEKTADGYRIINPAKDKLLEQGLTTAEIKLKEAEALALLEQSAKETKIKEEQRALEEESREVPKAIEQETAAEAENKARTAKPAENKETAVQEKQKADATEKDETKTPEPLVEEGVMEEEIPAFRSAAAPAAAIEPFTVRGNGNIGGTGRALYNWSAEASGDKITWNFEIERRLYSWTKSSLYVEFEIPETLEAVNLSDIKASYNGDSSKASVKDYSQGRGFYIYSPQEISGVGRKLNVSFTTKIADYTAGNYKIDFKPLFRHGSNAYLANSNSYTRVSGNNTTEKTTVNFRSDNIAAAVVNYKYTPPATTTSFTVSHKDLMGAPVTGSIFTLTDNNNPNNTHTFDLTSSGSKTISDLSYGTYTLRQTKVPEGHPKVQDRTVTLYTAHQYINIESGAVLPVNTEFTVKNYELAANGTINTSKPLAGGVFTLTNQSTNEVYTMTTGTDGTATISVQEGLYTLAQTKAPEGYALSSEVKKDLQIPSGISEAVIANSKIPEGVTGTAPLISLRVTELQKDAEGNPVVDGDGELVFTNIPIPGTTIRLTGDRGDVRTAVTDEDGRITFDRLNVGETYTAAVAAAPSQYDPASYPTSEPITIPQTLTYVVMQLGMIPNYNAGLYISTQEYGDPDVPIAGAMFRITGTDGSVREITTGENGIASISLPQSSYTVKQISSDDEHLVDGNTYTVSLTRQEELVVKNKLKNPSSKTEDITVEKVWEDQVPDPRPNVVINLLADKNIVQTKTIPGNSTENKLTFQGVPKYDANHNKITYTVEEAPIENYYAVIQRQDKDGYSWLVKNYEGSQIGECTEGTFWVANSTQAKEYRNDGTATDRTISFGSGTYGYSITHDRKGEYFYAADKNGNLRVWYTGGGSQSSIREITTSPIALKTNRGTKISRGTVAAGWFTYHHDYVHAAEVSNDGTKLFIKNWLGTTIYSYDISAIQARTNGGSLNAVQAIPSTYSVGDIVELENGDLLVSAVRGDGRKTAVTIDGFWITNNSGGNYFNPHKVGDVNLSGSTSFNVTRDMEGLGIVNGELYFTAVSGRRTIRKTTQLPNRNNAASTVYGSTEVVDTMYADLTDMTSSANTLCDAEIKIAGRKIWENDSEENRPESIVVELYKNGNPTGIRQTVTAETDWTYVFANLPKFEGEGRIVYKVREAGTPEGYTAVYPNSSETNNYNIINRFNAGNFYLHKTNEQALPMEGVQFTLYDRPYGDPLRKVVQGPLSTDGQGNIAFTNLKVGIYYLRETATLDGYQISQEEHTVHVSQTPGGLIRVNVDGVWMDITPDTPLNIVNKKALFELNINKVNGDNLIGINGAVFELRNENNEVVGTETSQNRGKVKFTDLPPGTYYLTETFVPIPYILPSGDLIVTIDGEGNISVSGELSRRATVRNNILTFRNYNRIF